MVLFWFFCGTLLLLLTQTVVVDEAAVQRAVREALAETGGSADLSGAPDIIFATTQNPLVAHAQGQMEPHAQNQESHPPSYQNGADVAMLESPVHNPLSFSLLNNAPSPTLQPQSQPQSQSQTASVFEDTSALRVSVAARAHRTYDVIP